MIDQVVAALVEHPEFRYALAALVAALICLFLWRSRRPTSSLRVPSAGFALAGICIAGCTLLIVGVSTVFFAGSGAAAPTVTMTFATPLGSAPPVFKAMIDARSGSHVTVSLRSERPLNSIVLINIGGNAGRIDSLLSPLLDVRDASVADTLSSAGRTALHDFRFATAPVEGQVSLQFTAPVWRYSYADREFVFIARAGEEPGLQVAAPADMDMTLPGNVVVTGTPAGTVLSSIGIGREVAGPITAGDKTAASDSVAVDWTDQGSAQQREFALFLSGVVAGALAAIVMETVFKAIVAD